MGEAGVAALILRRAADDRARRDGVPVSPDYWRLVAMLEQAAAEWRARATKGGTDALPVGGTPLTMAVVNVTQAAELLNITRKGVKMRIRRGTLRAELTPAGYRIAVADLVAA